MNHLATDQHPVLQRGRYITSDYDLSWLERVLTEAAQEAGVNLPFAQEVAAGVLMYLDEYCPLRTLPLEYFFARVRGLLREIGLPLVAEHLHEQMPPVEIDLDALAGEEPLPLFFYEKLKRRMEELRQKGLTSYRFSGMKHCSLVLGARQRACPTQRRVLQELRSFLAFQAA